MIAATLVKTLEASQKNWVVKRCALSHQIVSTREERGESNVPYFDFRLF